MADDQKLPRPMPEDAADAPAGPEGNAIMREVWSQPGGEAQSYRSAMAGAGGESEDHSELTAAETPETTRHLSDATLGPDDLDATGEAIARATAVDGEDDERGRK